MYHESDEKEAARIRSQNSFKQTETAQFDYDNPEESDAQVWRYSLEI